MILSDTSIREALASGEIKCEPAPGEDQIQPASLDLRLSSRFMKFRREVNPQNHTLDVTNFDAAVDMRVVDRSEQGDFLIDPGEFWLASTIEVVTLPAHLRGCLHGRSSLARLGLIIHSAGYIDPGFSGSITLELANVGPHPIALPIGWRIGQISFEKLDKPAALPYGRKPNSKYQGQVGPTASRSGNDRGGA